MIEVFCKVADVAPKAVFGVPIHMIGLCKRTALGGTLDTRNAVATKQAQSHHDTGRNISS